MESYEYTDLPREGHWIRLLILHPAASTDAELDMTLKLTQLDAEPLPEYEALSYVWGATENARHVFVHQPASAGQGTRRRLVITPNLHGALVHLRRAAEPRTLWVDAVCINQANFEEKGRQVARMGDIYCRARRALVWLGPKQDGSDVAMTVIRGLAAWVRNYDWNSYQVELVDYDSSDSDSPGDGGSGGNGGNSGGGPIPAPLLVWGPEDVTRRILNRFLHRPWFERLWVRQEVLLAKETRVHCGFQVLDWSSFRNGVGAIMGGHTNLGRSTLSGDRHFLIQRLFSMTHLTAANLRSSLRGVKCSDARDRVYGTLSFLHDRNSLGVTVDYSQTAADVYESLFSNYMRQGNDVSFLTGCGEADAETEAPGLPSWVPDLSTGKADHTHLGPRMASSNFGPDVSGCKSGRLSLGAVVAQTITSVRRVDNVPTGSSHAAVEAGIRRLWDFVCLSVALDSSPYGGGEGQIMSAFVESLAGGWMEHSQVPFGGRLPSLEPTTKALRQHIGLHAKDEPPTSPLDAPQVSDHWNRLLERFALVFVNRCLFSTADGYIGVGPATTKPGDVVAIILGLYAPIILRPAKEDARASPIPRVYKVIGESFTPGLNAGEALLGKFAPGDKISVILRQDATGLFGRVFRNLDTGAMTKMDPKLWSFLKDNGMKMDPTVDPEIELTGGLGSREQQRFVGLKVRDLQDCGVKAEFISLV